MLTTKGRRAASASMAVMLAAGFVYSGVATIGHLRRVVQVPPAESRSASIDPYLAPANLSSSEDLRRAVRCLRGPLTDEILLLADGPALSDEHLVQISYAAGYLLYPQRVRVVTESDAANKNLIRLSSVRRRQ